MIFHGQYNKNILHFCVPSKQNSSRKNWPCNWRVWVSSHSWKDWPIHPCTPDKSNSCTVLLHPIIFGSTPKCNKATISILKIIRCSLSQMVEQIRHLIHDDIYFHALNKFLKNNGWSFSVYVFPPLTWPQALSPIVVLCSLISLLYAFAHVFMHLRLSVVCICFTLYFH